MLDSTFKFGWISNAGLMLFLGATIGGLIQGAPDKLRGEVVAAYVVPSDPSLTVEELKEYCTNSPMLSSYKWPRIYNIVDSLPHTATGKIMHRALRKQK